MSNFNALKKEAEILLVKMDGKRYCVGDLNNRLQEAVAHNPQDTVIRAVASVIERMTNKEPERILSQAEFDNLYNEMVGLNSNTKFREVLGDLLISQLPKGAEPNQDYIAQMRNSEEAPLDYKVDAHLSSGFEKLFGQISDKYDPNRAAEAKSKVELELTSLGYGNPRVRLAGGNSRYLVFAADLDSNRGAVRVFIPAESSGDKFPSVFVAGHNMEVLTEDNLKNYVVEASYNNERLPDVTAILNTLDRVTGIKESVVSDDSFEKVASTLKEKEEGLSAPGIFASMPDENKNLKSVEIPKMPVPEPLKALASDLEESLLETSVGYPQATIKMAKQMVLNDLDEMGFKHSSVRVASQTHDGFICEASIDTPRGKVSIEVPIEISNNLPLIPAVFAKGDFVDEFNAAALHNFVKKAETGGFSDRGSKLYGMSLPELKEQVVMAASQNKFDVCNEILNVIAERVDDDTYRDIASDYMKILANTQNAKETFKQAYDDADQFVKTPNSLYPIHKKLGRPAHELIRDEGGQYHLKSTYYARQEEKKEGAFFSTAKILVGD